MFARRCVHGRNRSQPFATVRKPSATVRNRPQPSARSPYGRCLWEVLQRLSFLEVSDVSLLRFAWQAVALRDIQTCSGTCRKSFCVAGAILLRRFQKMCCSFSWQAQHFGRVHRHFSWQAQHFRRVVLRVFCKSHWQGCVKWRQGANSVAVVAFCAMC